jgi:hypothetical protein
VKLFFLDPVSGPPSTLATLAIEENDFEAYRPAPDRLAIRLVVPPPPPCGSGVPLLEASPNWWGCPDWVDLPFSGGPAVDCALPPNFPACPDLSVTPSGIMAIPWSPTPYR